MASKGKPENPYEGRPPKAAEDYITGHWAKRKVWNNLTSPKHQERFRQIASRCTGDRCCDVGCGFGHSTMHLATYLPGTVWTGADFSERAVAEARRRFPETEFLFLPSVREVVDLAPERFSTLVCSEVIEHVEEDATLVAGLCAAAAERVVITTPDRYVNDPGHLRLYTAEMLRNLLGGRDYNLDRVGPFWYVTVFLSDA